MFDMSEGTCINGCLTFMKVKHHGYVPIPVCMSEAEEIAHSETHRIH